MSEPSPAERPQPLYASFPRRIQALMLDAVVLVTAFVLLTSMAVMLPAGMGRWLNLATIVAILLYEPVMVARWGGTVGHMAMNLRVVHDDGARLNFPLAFTRFAIKAVLGLVSFLAMLVTPRYQALHDVVVHATVQVRDPSRAAAYEFHAEREEEETRVLPSFVRRLAVTLGYEMGLYVAFSILAALAFGRCMLDPDGCSEGERLAIQLSSAAWVVLAGAVALLGWNGRLPGARSRPREERLQPGTAA